MKNQFKYYWPLTDEEKKTIERNATYVFDTNVLLNLYRYPEEARQRLLDSISKKENIWLPSRVIEEYGRNRVDCIVKQENGLSSIIKLFDNLESQIRNYIRLDDGSKLLSKLKKAFEKLIEKIKEDQINFNDDFVLKRVLDLFNNKVGEPYDDNRIKEIEGLAKDRFEKQIPPGYKDAKKSELGNENIGDLIIWFQLMDYSKKENKDIVFVTDDNKEDWFLRISGKTISPRYELIEEFSLCTGKQIIIKNVKNFIKEDLCNLQEDDKQLLLFENDKLSESDNNYGSNINNIYYNISNAIADTFFKSIGDTYSKFSENIFKSFIKKAEEPVLVENNEEIVNNDIENEDIKRN